MRTQHQGIHLVGSVDGHTDTEEEKQRKLEQIKQLRLQNKAPGGMVGGEVDYPSSRLEKSRDLQFTDMVRER